ncbi:MAG: cupredoxin family protein [Parvibaculum sp.]|uniref:cupredoxin domain-containing protein n=1 Tax=Parvibaculum sp. TaxID=2024848 RepID=UPI0025D4B694|nr:cupredoxin family protein [Parvibaculum sp.]MCE9648402.1 cupredoxin family protein [Parvibaculum sp.]
MIDTICKTGFALGVFGLVLAAAMSASAQEMNMPPQTHEALAFGKPGDPKKVDRTVTIEATEIAFNVKELTFKKGETIRFVFVNKGEQPHEFTIANEAEQLEHRQMMSEMAGMDMAGMHHNDGNSISTEPGETKELIWTFTTAGKFEFACNYPGHAEVGMEGPLIVR